MVYPSYTRFSYALEHMTLSSKSVLIKCCQAQAFPTTQPSVLHSLLSKEPPVIIPSYQNYLPAGTHTLIDILKYVEFNPSDPLESAIYIDIIRFSTVDPWEAAQAKEKGWEKEIHLAMGTFRNEPVHWDTIFHEDRERYSSIPLHPDLPPNPNMANDIHNSLIRFRLRMKGRTLYSRATHKNMSWETRRDFEGMTHSSLEGIPIFGQDDYLRFYHETGILLSGSTEMRQKWYHSQAKPRTYFAMGGSAYRASRFLQDVFTELVDSFPSFNHKQRLRPSRLAIPTIIDEEDVHWRIYDLSSFTSNCCVQRGFIQRLVEFMMGIEVVIVDEREGPQLVDLGDLLETYYQECVERPELTLERVDPNLKDITFFHEVASMLGIFGNLMTCTFAHGSIVGMSTADVQGDGEYNCAGDDGLVPERESTREDIDRGIRIVGVYEPTKSYRGDDEAAICLKRPFKETFPSPTLLANIIPPTLATCLTALSPSYQDIRYTDRYDEDKSWIERVNVVARDLLRFLRSAYKLGYENVERLGSVYWGFRRLVERYTGWKPSAGVWVAGVRPFWPADPRDYEFLEASPFLVTLLYFGPPLLRIQRRERVVDVSLQFSSVDDEFEGNSTKRLKLLEMLGYVTKEEIYVEADSMTEVGLIEAYYDDSIADEFLSPPVYLYHIAKDIPWYFMYSD